MVQAEIIKYLTKKREANIVQLCNFTKVNRSNVSRGCRKLEKSGEVNIRKVKEMGFTKYIISLPVGR